MKTQILCVFLALSAMFAIHRQWSLETELATEQAAHVATRTALEKALVEGNRWKVAADAVTLSAMNQRDLATACLAREAEAERAASEREAILTPIKPQPRTSNEKVVDHATRRAVVARLNRPL